MLLYNGPMSDNNTNGRADYKDYVVLRLVGGRIQADLMFNGIVTNPIQIPSSDPLNDGKWHTVTLFQDGKVPFLHCHLLQVEVQIFILISNNKMQVVYWSFQHIELVIDDCYSITPIGTSGKIIGIDDSSCRRVKITADDDERLNVVTPLQVVIQNCGGPSNDILTARLSLVGNDNLVV